MLTTLHTILDKPSVEYFDSLVDVCRASDKVIVMNERGIKMLRNIYGVPESKIELVPHQIWSSSTRSSGEVAGLDRGDDSEEASVVV